LLGKFIEACILTKVSELKTVINYLLCVPCQAGILFF
jgi:hypothetical protein